MTGGMDTVLINTNLSGNKRPREIGEIEWKALNTKKATMLFIMVITWIIVHILMMNTGHIWIGRKAGLMPEEKLKGIVNPPPNAININD